MLFNSYIFVFIFLPLCVGVYFLLHRLGNKTLPQLWLLGMSLWFYGYFNPSYLLIICSSIIANYLISKVILRSQGRRAKLATAIGVVLNLAILFYFKYVDFFIYNINRVFSTDIMLRNIVLPLGISFFTFQQVSYILDSCAGETGDYGFIEYAVFVAFFPQLVAGPIVLHDEIIPQFRDEANHRPNPDMIARGLWLFAVGLSKKVLIADTLGKMVTLGYGGVEILSTSDVLLVMVAYLFQLYYDFSGYSDMASGIASMFGINLPLNFNSPYKCRSILDYWANWHLTLTRLLTKYIYIPLGGSKKGLVRTNINIIIVFIISGIWHGAGWTFIIWGILNGVAQAFTRTYKRYWDRLPAIVGGFLTLAFVSFGLIMFRADNFMQAFIMYRKVAKLESFAINPLFLECFTFPEIKLLERVLGLEGLLGGRYGLHMWGFLILVAFMTFCTENAQKTEFRTNIRFMAATAFMLAACILSFSTISTFLYFNF